MTQEQTTRMRGQVQDWLETKNIHQIPRDMLDQFVEVWSAAKHQDASTAMHDGAPDIAAHILGVDVATEASIGEMVTA